MSKVTWIKVGFFFSPEDRRRVEGEQICKYVVNIFQKHYREKVFGIDEDPERSVTFNILDVPKEEVREKAQMLKVSLELSEESFYSVVEIEDKVTSSPAPESLSGVLADVMEEVEGLVGAESFKELCRKLARLSTTKERTRLRDYFDRCAILFSISGGDGYSTYLSLLSYLLTTAGIKEFEMDEHGVREVKKAETDEEMLGVMEWSSTDGEMISFDLTYRLNRVDNEDFREFIRHMQRKRGDRLPVFKIPYTQGREKERMIEVLSSVFPLIHIEIPPLTTAEYSAYAMEELSRMGYKVEKKAHDEIEELIVQKRNEAHFYGFHSVKMLVDGIIYRKNLEETRRDKKMSLVIREEDLTPMIEQCREQQGGLEDLAEMVGMESIRERLDEIVVQLELAQKLPLEERPCMHMLFTGNPGTGKTTVARILGRILKEKGVLSKGQFFERTGRELVGRYIGETAPTTNAICRDAYGSILFIDEAYTLFKQDDERDFGKEALDTLITQMENHRQDFIVILSGYSDRMEKMMEANAGLAGRIPHEIRFRNYSTEELCQIYMNMAGRKYTCAPDLKEAAESYFSSLSKELLEDESFSNARFVRNLYERTLSKAALRLQAAGGGRIEDPSKIVLTKEDFVSASASEEFKKLQEKKTGRFGFA